MKTLISDSQQSLLQWVSQATGISTLGVKVRLRGNDLHILCEGSECPQRWRTLYDLLHALQQTDLDVLTSKEQPSIYQVFVYGRKKGEYRPQWCHKVYLNQLDRHIEQVKQALLEDAAKAPGGALILSNESLARRGDPQAIARYLSETLSAMGVSVQVKVKPHEVNDGNLSASERLWIFCQSSYNPDPSLLAEPIAQKLRQLELTGYKDAVIVSQIIGETKHDWRLRIDLTPPVVMLKEWARWGDVQAIAQLLMEDLAKFQATVQVSLQESTLHIFCLPIATATSTPVKAVCLDKISEKLTAIAPQGILAATVYGQKTHDDKQPEWIDWLTLPAKEYPDLATNVLDLAAEGDEPAIIFLLERLLNPKLDVRLKTGGLRVLLLRKDDLFHIMCDAPVCPSRKQVAPKVTQLIRQLKVPGIAGVRVYGRRAGNKEPFWHHGVDLAQRQRLVPEATPEFAATADYVGDLIPQDDSEPILRPDLTTEEVQSFVSEVARDWVTTATTTVKTWLLNTQLFTEDDQANQIPDAQGWKVALVWGTLGLLLTLQTDWVLGYIVTRNLPHLPQAHNSTSPEPNLSLSSKDQPNQRTAFFASNSQPTNTAFNSSGFTQGENSGNLTAAPLKEKANATAILLAARSAMPSFNVRQLDEQLALYRQRIARNGKPADVLIIGSSRALRGVDPAALSKALSRQGYPNIDIFNFGINGATAQVVDFVIRQVLQPSELPKLIIWADGSRAFNSGRDDLTFKAIATSPGYQYVLQQSPKVSDSNSDQSTKKTANSVPDTATTTTQPVNNYQVINQWLNQALANFSTSYQHRDQVQSLIQTQLASLSILKEPENPASINQSHTNNAEDDSTLTQAVDFDGFLPLSVRFHPTRYYQKHSKVSGNYDNDYKDFQLGAEQDAAFQDVLQFTQSQNIPLIFVNLPLTSEYLDSFRRQHEQEFQAYMLQLATNPNFIYRDLSQLFPANNDNFSDPSHLNRFGAYEVSQKLATDPMIPWK